MGNLSTHTLRRGLGRKEIGRMTDEEYTSFVRARMGEESRILDGGEGTEEGGKG
jgi:hypothetical protein